MIQYFAYIRVSTTRQGTFGVSLEQQRDAIQSYADRNQIQIIQWFEEQETAAKRGRPVFAVMLSQIRKGKARGIVIHKIDRSARNLRDWADLADLIDIGVDVRFATESLDMRSRGGRLSADIQAIVAADYIRNLKEEVRKGFYGRLKQGLSPLRAPVGYLDTGKGKPKTPDPARAMLVRRAFELYDTGAYSVRSLGEELFRVGLRSRNEKRLSINAINLLLRNPFYSGLIRIRSTGESFAGIHAPLISQRLFARVQNRLDGRVQRPVTRHGFVFSRLFSCRACGYSVIGEIQKRHRYYRCHTAGCPTRAVREDLILEAVGRVLRQIALSPAELSVVDACLGRLTKSWASDFERQRETLALEIATAEKRLIRLTDAFVDGALPKDAFEERRLALLSQKLDLGQRLAADSADPGPVIDEARKYLELAKSAYRAFLSGSDDERRALVETITSNRTVLQKDVSIELRNPYTLIAKRPPVLDCGACSDRPRTAFAQWADTLVRVLVEKSKAKSD